MKKVITFLGMLALVTGVFIPALPASADVKVSIFNFPGLTENDLSCADEVDNLKEIITDIGGYSIDLSITSLGAGLLDKLSASKFFFVPDMESSFNVASGTDFPSGAVTDFRTWLNSGGVLVMTGTSGSKDIDFLNKITEWGLVSASGLSGATRVESNVAGTPFGESTLSGVTLGIPSATDSIDKGTAPSSSQFKAMWGTDSQAPVAVMNYGNGRIIYLGFDYYDSGRSGAATSTLCGANSDAWVQKIIPAALRYATQLADAAAAAQAPAPVPAIPAPRLPRFDAFAAGPVFATPGANLVLTGSRLNCTTQVAINGSPTNFSHSYLPIGMEQLAIGMPSNLQPGPQTLSMDTCDGNVQFNNLVKIPNPPVTFEYVARNSLERSLASALLKGFLYTHYMKGYNHVECVANASAKTLQKPARTLLNSACKEATVLFRGTSTSVLLGTHKPESIALKVTLSSR